MTETALIPRPEQSEADEIAALEAEIVRGRQRVASSLGELQGRLARATSWRHWVGAHPVTWICAGVCLGFFVARRARRS
jgi:hypothetical protein